MSVTIRKIFPADEWSWRDLFDAYTRFYEREPPDAVARHNWRCIMDPASAMQAVVAENKGGDLIGFANYIIHESTSAMAPVCYLQDLFVDPARRGAGVGRLLIDWLVAETKAQGWSQLYWHTRENNYRARSLYDKYTLHSGSLRYILKNPGA